MIDLFVFLFEYFDQLQYEICLQRTLIECVLRVRSCRPARSRVGLHPQHPLSHLLPGGRPLLHDVPFPSGHPRPPAAATGDLHR